MKRKIKFRCWDGSKMEFFTLPSVFNGEDMYDTEIMQYTGLRDKKGKEIYEGDIYRYGKEYGVFESIMDFYFDELTEYRVYEGEIVGNMYENPELIKLFNF